MIQCSHAVCQSCFIGHFTVMIREKKVKHYNCPICGEPDLTSEAIDVDLYLQLFSGLVQTYLSKDDYNLCIQKIYEHTFHRTMINTPEVRNFHIL